MKTFIGFSKFAIIFGLGVYFAWAIDWDSRPAVPSYWDVLDNVQSEAAKSRALRIAEICRTDPAHEVCR